MMSEEFLRKIAFVHQRKAALKGNVEWFNKNKFANEGLYMNGLTCLHLASSRGHVDIVSKLTPDVYDVNIKDSFEQTALIIACGKGRLKVVLKLISLDADLDTFDIPHRRTPLIISCIKGYRDIAFALISNGACLNAKDNNGMTGLMYASSSGFTQIVLDLLSNGANPNIRCKTSSSALIYAVLHTHTEIVKILLSYGASPDLHDKWNENALDCIAYEKGHIQIEKLINTWKQTPRSLKFYVTRNVVSKVNSLLLRPNAFEKEIN